MGAMSMVLWMDGMASEYTGKWMVRGDGLVGSRVRFDRQIVEVM